MKIEIKNNNLYVDSVLIDSYELLKPIVDYMYKVKVDFTTECFIRNLVDKLNPFGINIPKICEKLTNPSTALVRDLYKEKHKFDFDVLVNTEDGLMSLQRELVWDINQKVELIKSMFKGLKMSPLHILDIDIKSGNKYQSLYQVIDGKQRLTTVFDFIDNKFSIRGIDCVEYFYKDLDLYYQKKVWNYAFSKHVIYASQDSKLGDEYYISDDDKIDWFIYVNYLGTPQDENHIKKFVK